MQYIFFPEIVHKLESEKYIKFGVDGGACRALKTCATSSVPHTVMLKDLEWAIVFEFPTPAPTSVHSLHGFQKN